MTALRVSLVDPSAFTPPYDRSLAAALARAGADVELLTSRFLYGPVPEPEGYRVWTGFYRRSTAVGKDNRMRLPLKAYEHIPDMVAIRHHLAEHADVEHWQWTTLPRLDRLLLGRPEPGRPRLLTLHYPLPRPGEHRKLARPAPLPRRVRRRRRPHRVGGRPGSATRWASTPARSR